MGDQPIWRGRGLVWTPLTGPNVSDYGWPYVPLGAAIDAAAIVHLRGLAVTAAAGIAADGLVAQLPAAFAPFTAREDYLPSINCYIINGQLLANNALAAGALVFLGGTSFPVGLSA